MRLGLTTRVILGFGAALLMLAIVSGISYWNIRTFSKSAELVSHTHDVIADVHQLHSELAVAGATARGVVLLPNDYFFMRYQEARNSLLSSVPALRRQTTDNPTQTAHVERLEALVGQRSQLFDHMVDLARAGKADEARDLIAASSSVEQGEQLRSELTAMLSEEERLLAERNAINERSSQLAAGSLALVWLTACGFLGWFAYRISREIADKTRAEAAESEMRGLLDGIMANCNSAIYAKDTDGRFLLVNHYCAALFGLQPEQMIGKKNSDLLPKTTADEIAAHDRQVWLKRSLIEFEEDVRIDGELRIFSSSKYTINDAYGKPLVLCGISTDITARKEAEAVTSAARVAAEQASQFKDQFLSTMSHELRTPLNAILGFSELLSDERFGTLTERQRRYVHNTYTAGQHLVRLISEILDLSKIEAGKLELMPEDIELRDAVEEAIGSLRPLAEKKSQALLDSVPSGIKLWTDPLRLRQVLTNLVGNAIKFTPDQGRILLAAETLDDRLSGPMVRVTVTDNGPGIPAEEHDLIFESFYRAKNSRWKEGTGMGLAIARRLIETQGGQFGVESEVGQGATFFFTLPVGTVTETFAEAHHDAGPLRGTVMVVEDNPASAQLTEQQLTTSGYRVVRCEDPRLAMSLAIEHRPSAITLDILMKPVNGWQILSELKRDERTRDIPVILVTLVDQRTIGSMLGADDYLLKPVEKDVLLRSVERCLSRRTPRLTPGTILVADDDPAVVETISAMLGERGYSITSVSDGAAAREAVAASQPSLVILDLVMPKISGFDLLAEWRSDAKTAALPIVVLTSKELSREEEEQLRGQTQWLFQKRQDWREPLMQALERSLQKP